MNGIKKSWLNNLLNEKGFLGTSKNLSHMGLLGDEASYIVMATVGTVLLGLGGGFVGGWDFSKTFSPIQPEYLRVALALIFNPYMSFIFGIALLGIGATGTYKDQNKQQSKIIELDNRIATLNAAKEEIARKLNASESALKSSLEDKELLNAELRQLNTAIVKNHLINLSMQLELGTTDRITMYYEMDNTFNLLARYSKNPKYNKVNRQKFAIDEGATSIAWEHAECIESNCPTYDLADNEDYFNYLIETYKFDAALVNSFRMKSCRIVALAVSDAGTHSGVIVFESTSQDFFDRHNGDLITKIKRHCEGNQDILSKYFRDGLNLNREGKLKVRNKPESVESEFLEQMGGGMQ
ncbi:hypothetical protein [Pseudomonas sp. JQ36]